jgi:hypothetical protein
LEGQLTAALIIAAVLLAIVIATVVYRVIAELSLRPCRTGDDAKIAAEAKLLASAPEMAKLLGRLVEIVRGDALLEIDPELEPLAQDVEKLLGMTQPERADEQHS